MRAVMRRVAFIFGAVLLVSVSSVSVASAATWSIQATGNAGEHSAFYDIACQPEALNWCYAAGKTTSAAGEDTQFLQNWDGVKWTNLAASPPEGSTDAELQSVDCITLICHSAGSYVKASGTFPLTQSGKTVSLPPSPEGATETRLKGIGCASAATCTAVGYSVKEGKKTTFSIRNAAAWSIQAVPQPAGAKSSELHGVDCASTTSCIAVGSYLDSGGTEWAMAASHNGTEWSLLSVAKPAESKRSVLLDVSCASSESCVGVGAYRDSKNVQVSFVARWNGSAWSHQASPNPAESTNTVFQNVSCVPESICVAVGDWFNGTKWQPMAQEWTGAAWALDTTPAPAGATFSLLEGVACRSETCRSVGWYTNSEGKNKTLSETR